MHLNPLQRKTKLQRFLDTVTDSIESAASITSAVPNTAGSTLKASLSEDMVRKAGLIAGGVIGLTAGSAGISSLRRRSEGARGNS